MHVATVERKQNSLLTGRTLWQNLKGTPMTDLENFSKQEVLSWNGF